MSRMRKHVIFVIDGSRSMEKEDVVDSSGHYQCRVDAVLDACFEFVEGQLKNPWSSPRDRYSFISFNDVAKVHFRAKYMGGRSLYQIRRDLETRIVPSHGTSYGAGLQCAWELANTGLEDAGEQCVIIFLSDGRPRDMNANCKRDQTPTILLRSMRERFRRRMTFHGVGVGPEDFQLLKGLCNVARGEFHQAKLSVGRGNFSRAPKIPGRPDTLSGTLSNISSTVSSMNVGTCLRRGLTLEDVEEAEWNNTNEGQFYCDKLELEGGTLIVHERDLIVRLRHKPFAAGGMRHCFRMWDMGALGRSKELLELVGKRSKFHMSVDDEIKGLKHDMRCHSLARSQAQEFNRRVRRFQNRDGGFHALAMSSTGLEVVECDAYRVEDPEEAGGFRYLLVEPFLDGKYVKYNGNEGYVRDTARMDEKQRCWSGVAQAFSHYTYDTSKGAFLVCDLQGVDNRITDPAVHSREKRYGPGDRGIKGMRDFVRTHVCNSVCRYLGLPAPSEPACVDTEEIPVAVCLTAFMSGSYTPTSSYSARYRTKSTPAAPLEVFEEEEEEDEEEEVEREYEYEYDPCW